LRRQHPLRRVRVDERICIEVRGDNIRPLIEDSMQRIVVLDIEHRNRTPSGTRVDVPAYPASALVCGQNGRRQCALPENVSGCVPIARR
jgi:hypothetical protein